VSSTKRQWPASNIVDQETPAYAKAQLLAGLADVAFIQTIVRFKEAADEAGGDLYLAAHRPKFDPHGQEIAREAEPDTTGTYETIGLTVEMTIGQQGESAEIPRLSVQSPAEEALAVAEALSLAENASEEFIESVTDLWVILMRFGGQVRILAHRREDQTVAYIFDYEHRDPRLIKSPMPDLGEAPEAQTEDEPEQEQEVSESEKEPVVAEAG